MAETVMSDLDSKVREFAATVLERPGVVTGWILCLTMTEFDQDGESYVTDYASGPGTSPVVARGLIETARDRLVLDLTGHHRDDTEDD